MYMHLLNSTGGVQEKDRAINKNWQHKTGVLGKENERTGRGWMNTVTMNGLHKEGNG